MAKKKKVAKKKTSKKRAPGGAKKKAAKRPAAKKRGAGKKKTSGGKNATGKKKSVSKKKGAAGKKPSANKKGTGGSTGTAPGAASSARRANAAGRATAPRSSVNNRPSSWLDAAADVPVIEQAARTMTTFMEAMADGIIEEAEVRKQERRLVALMKEIEPQLDDELHAAVTRLLVELTAYDLMQVLCAMHKARSQTTFQG